MFTAMVTSPILLAERGLLVRIPGSRNRGGDVSEENCRNHSRVLQGLRAVTLQEPQEDETRVDPVSGRDVQQKTVQWKWHFGKAALSPVRLILRWTSKHKTCRRQQPFRSADHWTLPRDVRPNED